MNSITLLGRVVAAPEKKETKLGTEMAVFCLAVPREGDKEKTDFFNCVVFQKTAENLLNFVEKKSIKKGTLLSISGTLNIDKYESSDGVKRVSPQVIARRFYICGQSESKENKENSIQES